MESFNLLITTAVALIKNQPIILDKKSYILRKHNSHSNIILLYLLAVIWHFYAP